MYEAHYGFTERPFSVQPDPAFLYLGPGHKRAFVMLEYGLMHRGGFTVISGEVGAGKTTLIRHLLTRIPEGTKVGLITSTPRHETELLPRIMLAFDQPFEGISPIGLYKRFQDFLIAEYAKGGGVVLIVDEAQNLGPERLEELRMLSNINAEKDQLLQLVIVGQPQLRNILQHPDMLQFCQRVSADFHIRPLQQEECHAYIEHRLKVAGGAPALFTTLAKQLIYRASRGIPRVINVICDTSLVYGFATEAREIGTRIVQDVLADKRQHGVFPVSGARVYPVPLPQPPTSPLPQVAEES